MTNFWSRYDEFASHKGILKEFTFRCMSSSASRWWRNQSSPFKMHLLHKEESERTDLSPNCWIDRAISLCSSDILHTFFGMSFQDLLNLEVDMFEQIERAVNDIAIRQSETMDNIKNSTPPKKE